MLSLGKIAGPARVQDPRCRCDCSFPSRLSFQPVSSCCSCQTCLNLMNRRSIGREAITSEREHKSHLSVLYGKRPKRDQTVLVPYPPWFLSGSVKIGREAGTSFNLKFCEQI